MRIHQVLLFAAGCVFTGVLGSGRFEGPADRATQGLLLWLAFYPFVASTSMRLRTYWLMLLGGVPLAVIADAAEGATRERLKIATLVVFLVALAGVLIDPILKRRRRRQPKSI